MPPLLPAPSGAASTTAEMPSGDWLKLRRLEAGAWGQGGRRVGWPGAEAMNAGMARGLPINWAKHVAAPLPDSELYSPCPPPGAPVPHAQVNGRLFQHRIHQQRQQAVLRQVRHRLRGDGGLPGRGLAPAGEQGAGEGGWPLCFPDPACCSRKAVSLRAKTNKQTEWRHGKQQHPHSAAQRSAAHLKWSTLPSTSPVMPVQ